MKVTASSGLFGIFLAVQPSWAVPPTKRDVYTNYPYTGPKVPVGDWIDPTINGNGKGFPRLVEPPAVKPAHSKPSNNINVISVSYVPNGVNIHFQTPFGLGEAPSIHWGIEAHNLCNTATGQTKTYVLRISSVIQTAT